MEKNNKGFTLAELLIVVAIIGVLVGISIPIFNKQIEKAKQATDLANMRSAYAAANAEWLGSDDFGQEIVYFYNGSTVVKSKEGIKGYGKSSTDARYFSSSLPFEAHGVPNNNGFGSYIMIKMNADGVDSLVWGGSYAGQNITNPEDWKDTSDEEKFKKDLALVNGLQSEFKNMTYGELRSLIMNEDGSIKDGIIYGDCGSRNNYNLCITLSYSTVNSSSGSVVLGEKKTNIFFKDIFDAAGYDVGLDDNQTYVINSIANNTQTVWVDLGIKKDALRNLTGDSLNQLATTAYTYVKSGGAVTPPELQQAERIKEYGK